MLPKPLWAGIALIVSLTVTTAPAAGAQESEPAGATEAEAATPLFTGPDEGGSGEGGPLVELAELSREAGALGEELHSARAELEEARREAEVKRTRADEARADADFAAHMAVDSQESVDTVAVQRYRAGGSEARQTALLASTPRDLIDRLEILNVLSGANLDRLQHSRLAEDESARLAGEADAAARDADAAAAEAEEHAAALESRHEQLRERISEVEYAVDALDAEARAAWTGGSSRSDFDPAALAELENGPALTAAASRIGAPYSWGATGPSSFDCSGLMVWSYAQTGKSLPRSSQMQAQSGEPVAREDVRPGDLVIYFPGATHVGMYAGDGRVLHASTYGVPVGLDPVDSMPIHSIRRY